VVARRPALAALLPLIAGILAHDLLPPRPALWLGLIAVLLAIALWRLRSDRLCSACLAAAIFLVGLTSAQLELLFFPGSHIGLFIAQNEHLADLELRIVEPPRISVESVAMRRMPPKQLVMAEVTAVETRSGWQPARGKVALTVEPPLNQLAAGQIIRALGWLTRPPKPENPGQFDFAAYDRRQGVLAEFRIRRSAEVQIVDDPGPPLLARLRQSARNLLAAGFSESHATDAAFLRMLLLGDADPLVSYIKNQFDLTGTAYLLSISGLHIAIFGGFVWLILRLSHVPPSTAVWISIGFMALYAAVALPTQTGVRSLLVCVAVLVALLLGKKTDCLQILSAAIAAILLVHPADLYDAGFQIGAVAVFGLILFAQPSAMMLIVLWQSREPLVGPIPVENPIKAPALAAWRFAWRTILASAVIWAAVLPLLLFYFRQVSPWSVPGGFVLLPITITALLAAAMKIVLTLICPWLAAWWAAGAALPSELLRHGVARLAEMPWAAISISPPRWWMFVIYYAALLLPLIPWRKAAIRWTARLAWIPACVMLLAGPPAAAAAIFSSHPSGGVHLTMLDIGAGQTALVRVSGGQTFFVDCGSNTVPDVYRETIHPYLLNEGVQNIDGIFLSHGDYDHISASAEITYAYHVTSVYMTPFFRTHAIPGGAAEALLHLLDSRGPPPKLLVAGDTVNLGGGASLLVLWPPNKCAMDSNNCGMVMKLTYAGKTILFTADIQIPPERELLKHAQLLKSDVLIAPHHGSAETSTLAFIKAVAPKLIICSNDRNLTHKQLTFDQIAKPWPVYRTNRCGEIEVDISPEGKIEASDFDNVPLGAD